jgi:phosphoribosylaminoimidazolecarboxamide formyltransferase/IMP cyclohydrolase
MTQPKRALLSVTDKTGIVELAQTLVAAGVEILSTGGTARVLREAQVPVVDLAAYTGHPEMLDGRVKTLHPKVFGGILGRRDLESHRAQMDAHDVPPIDVVVVNLYDFEGTIGAEPPVEAAVEQIDIGGPSLLRAAAKNHPDVLVLCEPESYGWVGERIAAGASVTVEERRRLAVRVFRHTARYDALISDWLDARTPEAEVFPERWTVPYDRIQTLRYGENPHQAAALYRVPGKARGWAGASVLQGKELSYNNLLDLDAALGLAVDLRVLSDTAQAVFIKHNNPCGAASASTAAEALAKARACDPVSAFGAVVSCTVPLDEEAARVLTEAFVEAVVAPGFDAGARGVLAKKKNLRVIEMADAADWSPRPADRVIRPVAGAALVQTADARADFDAELGQAKTVTRRPPSEAERQALTFAWTVAKHVRSNAIVFAQQDRVLAVGAGQMSRVDSVKICRLKAGEALAGSVVASDAFFPFRDGVDVLAEAGAQAIVQPGGSIRDEEVISAADEQGLAMLFTGIRHFRH